MLVVTALLVAAWAYVLAYWIVYGGLANGVVSIAFSSAVLLGPAAYLLWKVRSGRTAALPTSLTVTDAGFTLFYARGDFWNLRWDDPKAEAWMTDVTGTDAYPSWVPSGFYLGDPTTVTGRFWIPEPAYWAIMRSARAAGARIDQWETKRYGLEAPAKGTVVFRLRGGASVRPTSGPPLL
ncbi:MAG TPA: hypothetical protein VMG36_02060 [Thermoplasmata archaeon]|nr:hypothetical protein [Thermoplasmata archaeon]